MSQSADRLENILVGISLATIIIIAVAVGLALHKNANPVQVPVQPQIQYVEPAPKQEIIIQTPPAEPVQPQQKQQKKYHYEYKGPFIHIERDIEHQNSK